ncbi:putative effector protein [Erysiphe necator]|uniref:Putative effector protein n=1 Tax=Uncinula necator TaxID=52586 RepID=A0A0B1NZN4_UNCNE|nr:putative effector protein [Erysiphe necator]
MTRCAARVIAGFPALDELPSKPQNKNLVNKPAQVLHTLHTQQKYRLAKRDHNDPNIKSISYARAVADENTLPDPISRMSGKNLKPEFLRSDTRIIVQLAQDPSLRIMDTFLARTKYRSLLPRPELIKDVRIVPFGIAHVASSHADDKDLLAASQFLQPMTCPAQVERQEMRHTFLLGPVPKYGLNTAGLPEPLSLVEIKNKLNLTSIDTKKCIRDELDQTLFEVYSQ